MKLIKTGLLVIMSLLIRVPLMAQGFVPPAEGNAVVYFTRVSSYGGAVSFEFFHNDEFIGIFKKKNYMRLSLIHI